jgi:SAM-dependent methyltransferase
MPIPPYREIACVADPVSPELIDEQAYFLVNPDVRDAGMGAAEHFREHGQREGRRQAVNLAEVHALREEKLSRLRFRRPPAPGRMPGEAMNFLTEDLIAEFRIPRHPPVSSHDYDGFLADMQRASPEKLFLDVGAGLRGTVTSNMVNMDVFAAVSTDVVGVGEELPFEDDQFDFIVCGAVLEHTRRPWDVAREMCRVCKPGGTLRIDWPFISPVHGYPSHYFNATPEGVISLFEQYCDIAGSTVEQHNHPIQGLWWILALWRSGLPPDGHAAFEAMTIGEILARKPEELVTAEFCRLLNAETQRIIPAGSTLVATKRSAAASTSSLAAENAALQESLRIMRASTSWRITAPMRKILSGLRS